MKYTSPFQKINSNTLNNLPDTAQTPLPKEKNPLYSKQTLPNTSLHIYQSKSSNISYFQSSKYKVVDKKQFSHSKHNLKEQKLESSNDRLGKIHKLLENITNKHEQIKTKLIQIKNNTSNNQQNVDQCTFTPHIKHNPRYFIPSSLSQRTKDWGQNKARHYTSIRQELVSQEIKECTFSPKLVAKPRSTKILKQKALEQEIAKQTRLSDILVDKIDQGIKNKQKVSPVKKKSSNQFQYRASDIKNIKGLIKYEMGRIKFDF